jgi:hypothetical protein
MEEKFLSARETKDITDNVQGCEDDASKIKILRTDDESGVEFCFIL